jgi:hypothetical protein
MCKRMNTSACARDDPVDGHFSRAFSLGACPRPPAGVVLGKKVGRSRGACGCRMRTSQGGHQWNGNADVPRWNTSIRKIAVRSPLSPRTGFAKNVTTSLQKRPWTLRRLLKGVSRAPQPWLRDDTPRFSPAIRLARPYSSGLFTCAMKRPKVFR